MEDDTKDLMNNTKKAANLSGPLFRSEPDEMPFITQCRVAAFLQVVEKFIKSRRKKLRSLIGEAIWEDEVDGVPLGESESGKSIKALLDDINAYITPSGGGYTYKLDKVKKLFSDKGFEIDKVIDTEESINRSSLNQELKERGTSITEVLEDAMDEHDIDRDDVVDTSEELDTEALEALVRVGAISDEELKECREERPTKPGRANVSLDDDLKQDLQDYLEGKSNGKELT